MIESEHTSTFSVPVCMVNTTPSACFWNDFTGFLGVHCALALEIRIAMRRKLASATAKSFRIVSGMYDPFRTHEYMELLRLSGRILRFYVIVYNGIGCEAFVILKTILERSTAN